MQEEKEIKVEILENIEVKKIISTLKEIYNINFNIKKETIDTYWDTSEFKFFKLSHGFRLRIDNDSKFYLTYKALFNIPSRKENAWFIFEKEINLKNCLKSDINNLLKIANLENSFNKGITIDNLEEYFKKIGLHKHIIINKTRIESKNENFTICVDSVENLGIYIEIEASSHKLLNELLNKIPFEFKQTIRGYTNLYAQRILGEEIPDFDSKFKKNPDWNYLPGQKEIIEELVK